jgi:DNA-binding NarL/FixJ family response regulator
MKILMVDDHVMFLQGLKTLLSVLAPEHLVDTASTLAEALERDRLAAYELVLLDWHLAEGDGSASIARLHEAGCTARIVVLSGENSRALIGHSIELGAAGFIPKTYSSEMMLAALAHVLAGRIYLPALSSPSAHPGAPAPAAHSEATDPRWAELTPRQRDIFRAAARGWPNKIIARELGIAEATVKTHLTAVFAVLGVRNRTEAAIQASRQGIPVA